MYGYGASERGTSTIRPKLLKSITTGSAKQILRVSEGRAELNSKVCSAFDGRNS